MFLPAFVRAKYHDMLITPAKGITSRYPPLSNPVPRLLAQALPASAARGL